MSGRIELSQPETRLVLQLARRALPKLTDARTHGAVLALIENLDLALATVRAARAALDGREKKNDTQLAKYRRDMQRQPARRRALNLSAVHAYRERLSARNGDG